MNLKSKFAVSFFFVDILVVFLTLYFSYFFRGSDFALTFLQPVADNYLENIVFFKYSLKFYLLYLFSGLVTGIYSFSNLDNFYSQFKNLTKSCFVAFALFVSYYFFKRTFVFSRFVILFTFCLLFLLSVCTRWLAYRFYLNRLRNSDRNNLVVFTESRQALVQLLDSKLVADKFLVSGYYAKVNLKISGLKYLGDFNIDSKKHVSSLTNAVLQLGSINSELQTWLIDRCRYNQIEFYFMSDLQLINNKLLDLQNVSGLQLLHLTQTTIYQWPALIKRFFDIVVSSVLLVVLFPIWICVPILIKLDSAGTVLFKYLDDGTVTKRVGFKGQLFYMYKYRTMKPNSHSMRYNELSAQNARTDAPLVKIENDPRVTKLGQFLRKYDIDELPQLWNVLKGDMSLVGPRPHLPEEVANYKKHHNFVFTVKPGITGLSQVSGRCKLDFEKEVQLDTFYIENWSLWLDIKILFKTVFVVLKKNNS